MSFQALMDVRTGLTAKLLTDSSLERYYTSQNRRVAQAYCNYALNAFVSQAWFDQTYVDELEACINHFTEPQDDRTYGVLLGNLYPAINAKAFQRQSSVCYRDIMDVMTTIQRTGRDETTNTAWLMAAIHVFCGVDKDEVFSVFVNIIREGMKR